MVRDTSMLHTQTSTSLIEGLRDPNNVECWDRVVARYRPMIISFARRLGVAENDAEDVAQVTLGDFCTSMREGKYDRRRGRLKSWFFGITRNAVRRWRRDIMRPENESDTELVQMAAAIDPIEKLWDEEWAAAVLRQCLVEVRSEVEATTMRAFELHALGEIPAEAVSQELGITTNAVWLAKRRVLKRLQELAPIVEEIW